MVVSLLKYYNISRVIASPGATNIPLVVSMQIDPFFKMYSCVDERSAAYMAVGMAEETGEPVVLSCTGATSSRNYMPGLTEAYYRKLPVIAITSSQDETLIGHLIAQVTDRRNPPKDVAIENFHIQNIRNGVDEWDCTLKLNRAFQLYKLKCGPVHINLATGTGNGNYQVKELPKVKTIDYYVEKDKFPTIPPDKRIAVFVGSHKIFTDNELLVIDRFCECYNAVVFHDHTSGYKGKYGVQFALIGAQDTTIENISYVDILIHIGEVSGDYDTLQQLHARVVWRVNDDGLGRDTFKKLEKVFCVDEECFFSRMIQGKTPSETSYYNECRLVYDELIDKVPELPFSNIYIAHKLSGLLPKESTVYVGILHSLRSWNYFELSDQIKTVCNVGGFGIDGIASSMIGASFTDPNRLFYAFLGDLSFFYDMNCLGNRCIMPNIRIMVINNGHGQEFQMYNRAGAFLGEDVNKYVAAGGHFGKMSKDLLRHYAQDLGFEYLSAETKEDFDMNYPKFIDPKIGLSPILFEVFTQQTDENLSLKMIRNIKVDMTNLLKGKARKTISKIKRTILP